MFSEDDIATLDAEIEQIHAANFENEHMVDDLRLEVSDLESSLDSYGSQLQALSRRECEVGDYLSQLQTQLVTCLRTVPLPELASPVELCEDNLVNFFSQIQCMYGGPVRTAESASLFSAIKSALAEVEVN